MRFGGWRPSVQTLNVTDGKVGSGKANDLLKITQQASDRDQINKSPHIMNLTWEHCPLHNDATGRYPQTSGHMGSSGKLELWVPQGIRKKRIL